VFTEILQKIIDLLLLSKLGGFVNSMLDNVFTTSTTSALSNSVRIELKTHTKEVGHDQQQIDQDEIFW
jgi:hypothetical protein